MGNLFVKRQRSFNSIALEELNRPLIPDVQHDIYSRLNILEKTQQDLVLKVDNIQDSLKIINDNTAHRNVTINTDLYKINESIHNICTDMGKLVKNDKILKSQLDIVKDKINDIEKKKTIQALYTSESTM